MGTPNPHARHSNVVQSPVLVLEICAACAGALCCLRWSFVLLVLEAVLHVREVLKAYALWKP